MFKEFVKIFNNSFIAKHLLVTAFETCSKLKTWRILIWIWTMEVKNINYASCSRKQTQRNIWDKLFKNRASEICGRQRLKIRSDMICLSRPYHFKIFKGCLPQILLGPFLNTCSHLGPCDTYITELSTKFRTLWHIYDETVGEISWQRLLAVTYFCKFRQRF